MRCICDPVAKDGYEYVQWIADVFDECYYTPRDIVSFVLGMLNIFFWLIAQVPQIVSNCRTGNVEALSISFLLTWLGGDTTNLFGCIFTHQLPTQLYTAIYYCCCDVVMLTQWGYFTWKKKRDDPAKEILIVKADDTSKVRIRRVKGPKVPVHTFVVLALGGVLAECVWGFTGKTSRLAGGRVLDEWSSLDSSESSGGLPVCGNQHVQTELETVVGSVCSWVCFLLYFFGRVPQVIHNYKRKSTEGLSMTLFLCSTLANLCYGTSIVIVPESLKGTSFWANVLPFVLGSYGCIVPPIIILFQFYYYNKVYPSKTLIAIEEPPPIGA